MVKLIAVGDISLITKNNLPPFEGVKEIFRGKDILFGNLEAVLSNRGKKAEKRTVLYTSPKKVRYLKDAGFDVLNIANNHIMDLGPEGFNETLEVLNQNDISFIGAGNQKFKQHYAIIEKKGIKLGFLGYMTSRFKHGGKDVFINRFDENNIIMHIKDLKSTCDIVVVSLHWGIENVFYPSPEQQVFAKKCIDVGACVILGHHPHVFQGIERYQNGLIVYSLANFQFDFDHEAIFEEKLMNTLILTVNITKNGVKNYDIVPARISKEYVPHIVTKNEKEKLSKEMSEISRRIIEGRVTHKFWFEQISYEYLRGNMSAWIIRVKRYGVRHLIQFIIWLISPFVIRCYIGTIVNTLRKKR